MDELNNYKCQHKYIHKKFGEIPCGKTLFRYQGNIKWVNVYMEFKCSRCGQITDIGIKHEKYDEFDDEL